MEGSNLNDITKTQHYSKEELLIDGFKELLPKDGVFIEPFYGQGSLSKTLNI